ncbi:MAG: hypothetical protein HY897_11520 [Deltaproteobacteria bacterium]|nr:hypothetical protein [Deltaproteobacteria bacterium]
MKDHLQRGAIPPTARPKFFGAAGLIPALLCISCLDGRVVGAALDAGSGRDAGSAPDAGSTPKKAFRAGASKVPITPMVETLIDSNDNGLYDSGEVFEDLNGNGVFDPVWVAGFGQGRLAHGVLDDLWARCLFLEFGDERLVLVALDLVGFNANRIADAKDAIQASHGIPKERVVIASTHTHSGPDAIGYWGPTFGTPGRDPAYMDLLQRKIVEGVGLAMETAVEAAVKFTSEEIPDVFDCQKHEEANGCAGDLVRDGDEPGAPGRDPIIVDRNLFAVQFLSERDGLTVATMVNIAAHPEILWDGNHFVSSDYPHFERNEIENALGGVSIHFSGALGGMMTPTVAQNSYVEVERFGRSIGRRVLDMLAAAAVVSVDKLGVSAGYAFFPIDEKEWAEIAKDLGVIEVPEGRLIFSMRDCKEKYGDFGCDEEEIAPCAETAQVFGEPMKKGCAPIMVQTATVGDAQIVTVPGELFPELANGLPDDFSEFDPIETRPNKYFPQHDPEDEWTQHASPYTVGQPLRVLMTGKHKIIIGLANHEGGYFVPTSDFRPVAPMVGAAGDHYEESVSLGPRSTDVLMKKLAKLLEGR